MDSNSLLIIVLVGLVVFAVWVARNQSQPGLMCVACGLPIRETAHVQFGGSIRHARRAPTLEDVNEQVRKRWK